MFRGRLVGLLLGAVCLASPAGARERRRPTQEITFERAMQLASERGPDVAVARARLSEARGRVDSASVRRLNPRLEVSAGPRFSATEPTIDWSVGARQWVEVGGQRAKRVEAAGAGVEAAAARADDAKRLLRRDVGLVFVRALYWSRRVALAQESLDVAEAIDEVARRRHELGDTGGLEASVASLSLMRAHIDEVRARVALGQAEGRLKVLLGFEAGMGLVARGDLRQLGLGVGTVSAKASDVSPRPDLRALMADIRQAGLEARVGGAARVPNIALGAGYSREEGADIVQATLAVALPFFDHGQGRVSVARSRRVRVETSLRGARRRVAIEVDTAKETSARLRLAVRQFEARGLAMIDRSERVATASYAAGAMPLAEQLAVRRELLQAKLDYVDLLLSAACARVEVMASMGATR
ncbi:MAG: TolC family protein [Nannocystaceae bacterium]